MTTQHTPPDWAFEFHGHRCPFMPLGYRMGVLAMQRLGVEREKDHGFFVFPEIGEGHPQTCMADGLQAATGATYGKVVMAKTFYGKLAAVFYHPDKGAVRYALRPSFLDGFGAFEFFAYRKRGVEPSQIPVEVTDEVIAWTYEQPDDDMFIVQDLPDFSYVPVKGSFSKTLCTSCGEYVFDRYVRMRDGAPVCIPCSGYEPASQRK
jgi:formylmethanofuran dehydrogenase subunit E